MRLIMMSAASALAVVCGSGAVQAQQQSKAEVCKNPQSSEAFQACIQRGERAGHRGRGAIKWCEQNNNGCP